MHEVVEQVTGVGVETGVGLVEQPELWGPGHQGGQRHPASLPGRQTGGGHAAEAAGEAEALERRLERPEPTAGGAHGEAHVVLDRQVVVEVAGVGEQADPASNRTAVGPQVVPEHLGLAVAHGHEAGAHPQQRRLARTVRAFDQHHLTGVHLEVDFRKCGEATEESYGRAESHGCSHRVWGPWYEGLPGIPIRMPPAPLPVSVATVWPVRRVVSGVGRALIGAGLVILLFVAYQLWGTGLAESRSQQSLRDELTRSLQAPSTGPTSDQPTSDQQASDQPTSGQGSAAGPQASPPGGGAAPPAPLPVVPGQAVALLQIPRIGLDKAVIEGVGVDDLKKGPGRYPETPLPGQPGNAAIAGHRTTYGAPFERLDELTSGDPIDVTTRQGRFRYQVTQSRVVGPQQREVLDPTPSPQLTLTTCHPRFSSSERLVITAALVTSPAPATVPTPGPAPAAPPVGAAPEGAASAAGREPSEAGLSGDPSARTPAVVRGLAAAAAALAVWFLARVWRRWPAYLLGAPLVLALLFAFFEEFARLLPANA